MTDADIAHMRAALALARRGLGTTWPNPSVGCVIVRDGRVVGRGRTAAGGRPHAEPVALEMAGDLAKGATAYVTLEPCCHWGQSPPCTDALIAAGIGRVVVATGDPDRRVNGQGLAKLQSAGIDVVVAMRKLAEAGLTRIMVEGGGQLAAALLRADLVDKIAWFHAPAVMGGDGWPAVQAFGIETLEQMPRFRRDCENVIGHDMLSEYTRQR